MRIDFNDPKDLEESVKYLKTNFNCLYIKFIQ